MGNECFSLSFAQIVEVEGASRHQQQRMSLLDGIAARPDLQHLPGCDMSRYSKADILKQTELMCLAIALDKVYGSSTTSNKVMEDRLLDEYLCNIDMLQPANATDLTAVGRLLVKSLRELTRGALVTHCNRSIMIILFSSWRH